MKVLRIAVVVTIVPSLLLGCSEEEWHLTNIDSAAVDDGRVAAGPHCHSDARLKVHEEAVGVVISLEVKGGTRGDCYDCAVSLLPEELSGEVLIDAFDDQEVDLSDDCSSLLSDG